MKVWKIVHKERDHTLTWRKVYSIVPAETREEALERIDRHSSLLIKITCLGQQPKDDYEKYWKIWEERLEDRHRKLRIKIYRIK